MMESGAPDCHVDRDAAIRCAGLGLQCEPGLADGVVYIPEVVTCPTWGWQWCEGGGQGFIGAAAADE